MTSVDDINSLESEAGIIASLIHKPDFIFYSEYLLPKGFCDHILGVDCELDEIV